MLRNIYEFSTQNVMSAITEPDPGEMRRGEKCFRVVRTHFHKNLLPYFPAKHIFHKYYHNYFPGQPYVTSLPVPVSGSDITSGCPLLPRPDNHSMAASCANQLVMEQDHTGAGRNLACPTKINRCM